MCLAVEAFTFAGCTCGVSVEFPRGYWLVVNIFHSMCNVVPVNEVFSRDVRRVI